MIIRSIHKKPHASGRFERLVREFSKNIITVGRGADSDIILEGARVAPSHARFVLDGNGLLVHDLGSLAGVRVNNRRVSTAQLKDGDTVTLGDIEVSVSLSDNLVELTLEAVPQAAVDLDERVRNDLRQFQVEAHVPSMRVILLTLAAVTLLACGVYPLVSKRFVSWNSGPISNAHKLIAYDCKKCHAEPFVRVRDQECLQCHKMTEHSQSLASFTKQHPELEMRCGACHMEHNGDHGLRLKDADFCVSCHATMPALKSDSAILAVRHFEDHPQFRITVKDAAGKTERVSLDDTAKAVDHAQIKLNHAVHLRAGLRGPQGPTTLTCQSCHEFDSDFKRLRKVSFDKHCRDCHTLGFDERLPDAQVPHGDAEAVYPALFTEYSKLLATALPSAGGELSARRFPSGEVPNGPERPLNVAAVERSARGAETQLFTKTACFLCHSYDQKDPAQQTPNNSHYTIKQPNVPDNWLPAAHFSHGAHEEFSCESCHEKTRNSTETRDVLLPGIKLCRDCHQQGASPGYVESGCGECHSYHDSIGFPDEKKHNIAGYLRGLTR